MGHGHWVQHEAQRGTVPDALRTSNGHAPKSRATHPGGRVGDCCGLGTADGGGASLACSPAGNLLECAAEDTTPLVELNAPYVRYAICPIDKWSLFTDVKLEYGFSAVGYLNYLRSHQWVTIPDAAR